MVIEYDDDCLLDLESSYFCILGFLQKTLERFTLGKAEVKEYLRLAFNGIQIMYPW